MVFSVITCAYNELGKLIIVSRIYYWMHEGKQYKEGEREKDTNNKRREERKIG